MVIATQDWPFFMSAWALGAVGVLLVVWALLADRAKGRRRCPKCWYDMSAVASLVCPECGRDARRERYLYKSRRRWRWVFFAVFLLMCSYVTGKVPAVRRGGLFESLPTWCLILCVPQLAPDSGMAGISRQRLADAIETRLCEDLWTLRPLWRVERRLLVMTCCQSLREESHGEQRYAARLLVLATSDAVACAPEPARAEVILAEASHRHATCGTFVAEGVTIVGARQTPFILAVDREKGFRYECRLLPWDGEARQFVALGDTGVASVWYYDPRQPVNTRRRQVRGFQAAFESLLFLQASSEVTLPAILKPADSNPAWGLMSLTDVRLVGRDRLGFEGEEFVLIEGADRGERVRVWVDPRTFSLARIERTPLSTNSSMTNRVTAFRSHFDVAIDQSWFEVRSMDDSVPPAVLAPSPSPELLLRLDLPSSDNSP